MEKRYSSMAAVLFFVAALMVSSSITAVPTQSFEENFNIMWSENHFTTSEDGQIWNLALDNDTGTFGSISQESPVLRLVLRAVFLNSRFIYLSFFKQDVDFRQSTCTDSDGSV